MDKLITTADNDGHTCISRNSCHLTFKNYIYGICYLCPVDLFICRLWFEQYLQAGRPAEDALWVTRVRRPGAVRSGKDLRSGDRRLEPVSSAPSSNLIAPSSQRYKGLYIHSAWI